jgi:hypothetical protein
LTLADSRREDRMNEHAGPMSQAPPTPGTTSDLVKTEENLVLRLERETLRLDPPAVRFARRASAVSQDER